MQGKTTHQLLLLNVPAAIHMNDIGNIWLMKKGKICVHRFWRQNHDNAMGSFGKIKSLRAVKWAILIIYL